MVENLWVTVSVQVMRESQRPHRREESRSCLFRLVNMGRTVLYHHDIHVYYNRLEKVGWNTRAVDLKGRNVLQL